MTQALNWAAAGGGATAKNNAQLIRQRRTLRRSGLRSPVWSILFPRIKSLDLTFRPTDNVSESNVMCGHISISLRATRRAAQTMPTQIKGEHLRRVRTVPGDAANPGSSGQRLMCSSPPMPPPAIRIGNASPLLEVILFPRNTDALTVASEVLAAFTQGSISAPKRSGTRDCRPRPMSREQELVDLSLRTLPR